MVLSLVGGCGDVAGSRTGTASQQPPEAEVRTDREPVEKRFPQFGRFTGVEWAAAPLGQANSRVPGPTDVRLSGVATLAEADVRRLLKEYDWVPAAQPPAVLGSIVPEVPEGTEWRTSEEFTSEVTRGVYTGSFHLDPGAGTMVFDAVNPTAAQGS
ncbi:hypothetical protein [Streptomyces sp. TLI_105]|uniref:hypothetical protein n=1 Tax=Streptomyces sp. TLI_105 TaxID=1881019 RepID=UPI00089620E9|nr:hypothetical protein [Streptomyces sp. TLI_105]SEB99286.1 hypothetical protein SAMN05428939_1277 [Streptomyces sp. TLI_105]